MRDRCWRHRSRTRSHRRLVAIGQPRIVEERTSWRRPGRGHQPLREWCHRAEVRSPRHHRLSTMHGRPGIVRTVRRASDGRSSTTSCCARQGASGRSTWCRLEGRQVPRPRRRSPSAMRPDSAFGVASRAHRLDSRVAPGSYRVEVPELLPDSLPTPVVDPIGRSLVSNRARLGRSQPAALPKRRGGRR